MSKNTNFTHKADVNQSKYYGPDERLTEWINERLCLERERRKSESQKGGGKMSPGLYKKMKSSAARKTGILDEIIFPSLANLIYLFESLTISQSLKDLFEKDVIELLDPRFVVKDTKDLEMGMNTSSYQFRENNLARLISTALKIEQDSEKGRKPIKDFRIALLYQLQSIIRDQVHYILYSEYGFKGQITKSATNDFDNALGWLALIAKSISESDKKLDRNIGFLPIWVSNNPKLHSMRL